MITFTTGWSITSRTGATSLVSARQFLHIHPLMPPLYRDGSSSYVVKESDLHPFQPVKILLKYADSTYLLVCGRYIQSTAAEIENISRCAAANNLRLNPLKTKELIVHRKRAKLSSIPELPFI